MITPKQITWIAKSANSVAEIPITADTVHTIAEPIGIRTNDASESYELTRERASAGTCCLKTLNQRASAPSRPRSSIPKG